MSILIPPHSLPIRRRHAESAGDIVVMAGSAHIYLSSLRAIAENFGWAVGVTDDLDRVVAAQASRKTVAVLFGRDTLGRGYSWLETTRLLRRALPEVHLLPCHGFSEPVDWPELCEAGAFHGLWLPLRDNEVHQSLGFVWEAEKRLANSSVRRTEINAPASPLGAMERLSLGDAARLRGSSLSHATG